MALNIIQEFASYQGRYLKSLQAKLETPGLTDDDKRSIGEDVDKSKAVLKQLTDALSKGVSKDTNELAVLQKIFVDPERGIANVVTDNDEALLFATHVDNPDVFYPLSYMKDEQHHDVHAGDSLRYFHYVVKEYQRAEDEYARIKKGEKVTKSPLTDQYIDMIASGDFGRGMNLSVFASIAEEKIKEKVKSISGSKETIEPNQKPDVQIHVVKLNDLAILPKAQTGSVGYQIFTPSDFVIEPRDSIRLPIGMILGVPRGWYVKTATHQALSAHGVIDIVGSLVDHHNTNELSVTLINFSDRRASFKMGDCVGQLLVEKAATGEFKPTLSFSEEALRGDSIAVTPSDQKTTV